MTNQPRTPAHHYANREKTIGTKNYFLGCLLRDGRCRSRLTNRAPPPTGEALF